MEQIYVENKKKNKKPKFMNVTIGLSFAVAFVAILSIVLISMSGSSYSLSAVDFPDKITTTESGFYYVGFGSSVTESDLTQPGSWTYGNPYMVGKDSANKSYDLLCLQSAKDYTVNVEYNNSKTMVDDPGFVYLSAQLQNSSKLNSAPQAAKAWIKQQATWAYFGLVNKTDSSTNSNTYTKANALNDLKAVKCVIGFDNTSREPKTNVADCCKTGTTVDGKACAYNTNGIFAEYGVDKWINDAVKYHENGWPALTVNVTKESSDFKLTADKKYYTSSPIAVSISTDDANGLTEALDDYTVSLSSDAPKGTKIMAWDGKKLVDVTNEKTISYSKYQSLRVYVPSGAETGTYNFNLAVTGTIQQYTGYFYEPTGGQDVQKITTVDVVNKTSTGEAEFSVQIVPDTATNLSKTIYIIGLIVLVSGLGILYVNVKKQKRFEQ